MRNQAQCAREPETGALLGASARRGRADARWAHKRREAVRIPGGYTHAPENPSHGRVQLKAGSKPAGRRRRGSHAGDAAERKEAKDPPLVRANARRHSDKGGGSSHHPPGRRAISQSEAMSDAEPHAPPPQHKKRPNGTRASTRSQEGPACARRDHNQEQSLPPQEDHDAAAGATHRGGGVR